MVPLTSTTSLLIFCLLGLFISDRGAWKSQIIVIDSYFPCSLFFLVKIHNIDIPLPKIMIHKDDTTSKHLKKKHKEERRGQCVCVCGGITELTDGIISLCVAHGAYLAFGSDM